MVSAAMHAVAPPARDRHLFLAAIMLRMQAAHAFLSSVVTAFLSRSVATPLISSHLRMQYRIGMMTMTSLCSLHALLCCPVRCTGLLVSRKASGPAVILPNLCWILLMCSA